jgi:hypothetical protein
MSQNNDNKEGLIPVSIINDWDFCHYIISLLYVRGFKDEENSNTKNGKLIHKNLQIESIEEGLENSFKIDLKDKNKDKESNKEDNQIKPKIRNSNREVLVEDDLMTGTIDEVIEIEDKIVIIDDKPNNNLNTPYNGDILQAQCYGMMYEQSKLYSEKGNKPIYCAIRDRDNKDIIWAKELTIEDKDFVNSCIDDICRIIAEEDKPLPDKNMNKHINCRLKNVCDWNQYSR